MDTVYYRERPSIVERFSPPPIFRITQKIERCRISFVSLLGETPSNPHLNHLKFELLKFNDDLLKYSVRLLEECQNLSIHTPLITNNLSILIKDLAKNFKVCFIEKPLSLSPIFIKNLELLKLAVIDKTDEEIVSIFEIWFIKHLAIIANSIESAVKIKKYYPHDALKKTLSYISDIFNAVITQGAMEPLLIESRKKIVIANANSFFPHKSMTDEFFFPAPIPPFDELWWIKETPLQRVEDPLNRRKYLSYFCDPSICSVDRFYFLILYLSYPTPLSSKDWDLIEEQFYDSINQSDTFTNIIDEEIAQKVFQGSITTCEKMKSICQHFRRNLHPQKDLFQYLVSSLLLFFTRRMKDSLMFKDHPKEEVKELGIFISMYDCLRMVFLTQNLRIFLSKSPHIIPKELDSFFSTSCAHLYEILKILPNYEKKYLDWPVFQPKPTAYSKKLTRITGFFNYLVLEKLLTFESKNNHDVLKFLRFLSPEILINLLETTDLYEKYDEIKNTLFTPGNEKEKDLFVEKLLKNPTNIKIIKNIQFELHKNTLANVLNLVFTFIID